jgi:uncharacterized protein YkwD
MNNNRDKMNLKQSYRDTINTLCDLFTHIPQLELIRFVKQQEKLLLTESIDILCEQLLKKYPLPSSERTEGNPTVEIVDLTESDNETDSNTGNNSNNNNNLLKELHTQRMNRMKDKNSQATRNRVLYSSNQNQLEKRGEKHGLQNKAHNTLSDWKETNKSKRQDSKISTSSVQSEKTTSEQLIIVRQKNKSKWRDCKATSGIMTMQDLEKKNDFIRQSKIEGYESSNNREVVHTIENTLYDVDRIGKEALKYTNEFRAKHGLPPLKWSQPIANIGKKHSKDMGDGKVPFGHEGFNKRVKEYPVPPQSAAENVAWNSNVSDVARVAVDGWIKSPGHRKNLLSNHTYCGIGVYRNSSNAFYLTQLFALY